MTKIYMNHESVTVLGVEFIHCLKCLGRLNLFIVWNRFEADVCVTRALRDSNNRIFLIKDQSTRVNYYLLVDRGKFFKNFRFIWHF